jgi:V/A-type H+-transporting ATPase subunit E
MEVQLQEIIEKIKREGLDKAQVDAQATKDQAQKEATRILAQAQEEAAQIRAKGKQDAERFEESAKAALVQAARDVTLSVKKSIESQFARLAAEAVKENYSPKVIEDAILAVIKAWGEAPAGAVVQVDQKSATKVMAALQGKLKDAAKKELSIAASPAVSLGFRIQEGGAYYDFGAEAIAKALATFVNPAVAAIFKAGD